MKEYDSILMKTFEESSNIIIRLWYKIRKKKIINLTDYENKVVVDIGCGECNLFKEIAKKCDKVYCIDTISRMGNFCRDNMVFVNCDAQSMNLKDGIADVVVCADVLNLLQNPRVCVREMKRIAKPEGIIIVCVPNPDFTDKIRKIILFFGLKRWFKDMSLDFGGDEIHIHRFSKKSIVKLLESEGLLIKRCFYHPFFTTIFVKAKKQEMLS